MYVVMEEDEKEGDEKGGEGKEYDDDEGRRREAVAVA